MDNTTTKSTSRKSLYCYVILFLIIFLQLGRIIYAFAYLKEDFHSDEIWSFGLSNSYYEPFIFQSADHTETINNDKWISSDVMKDYLTVDKDQRFSYGSVYYNQVHDYHPPLYYFILHTICSFFPERFSPWYGFSINILAFVFTMFFMYKLLFTVSKSEITALIGCAFYGFSIGAVNTFVFVRMYCLLTMFSVALLYYHAELYKSRFSKNNLLILFIVSLCGCLTHHFFIPYAGLIAACFFIYYLIKKRIKDLISYSVTMLCSVAASLIIFPATIDHLFSGRIDDTKLPYMWQIKMAINCLLTELFGFSISVIPKISYTALLIEIICALIILAPLVFLFRKEEWFKKFIRVTKKGLCSVLEKFKTLDLMIVSVVVSTVGIMLLTSLTVSLMVMGVHTDRYIFYLFPGTVAAVVWIVTGIARFIIKKKWVTEIIALVVSGALCISSNCYGAYTYLLTKPQDIVHIKSVIDDSDCVFICTELWLLTCFTKDSVDAQNLYITTAKDLEKVADIPDPPSNQNSLYYFVEDRSFFIEYEDGKLGGQLPSMGRTADQSDKMKKQDFEELLMKKYSKCENIGYDTVMGRTFYIYRVK